MLTRDGEDSPRRMNQVSCHDSVSDSEVAVVKVKLHVQL